MNFTPITYINTSTPNVCELDQYALLEQTKQLPIIVLWLSIAIFLILGFYWIVLPFLYKSEHHSMLKEALPGMAFALSIWMPLILMYFTLGLTTDGIKRLEFILTIISVVLMLGTIYYYRRRIITWFKSLQ